MTTARRLRLILTCAAVVMSAACSPVATMPSASGSQLAGHFAGQTSQAKPMSFDFDGMRVSNFSLSVSGGADQGDPCVGGLELVLPTVPFVVHDNAFALGATGLAPVSSGAPFSWSYSMTGLIADTASGRVTVSWTSLNPACESAVASVTWNASRP